MNITCRLMWLLFGVVLSAVTVSAYAATVPYKFNGINVTRDGGVTHLRGTSPAEVTAAGVSVSNHVLSVNGSANWYQGTGALLQNGGVVFNAAVPIAATAASVAVTAIKLNPAGLITSAVASYLLGKGIEYINGEIVKSVPNNTQPSNPPTTNYCANYNNSYWGYSYTTIWTYNGTHWKATCAGTGPSVGVVYGLYAGAAPICPAGATYVSTQCVGTLKAPAVDSDWDAARVGYWPDPAILDLVKNGVSLPTDKAVFTPLSKDVPISDPVVDPVTGKRYQDIARVTPSPTDPTVADIQVVKQEVDAAGVPVVNPATNAPVAPEEEKDPCKINPDASACKPLDDVPDSDLLTDEISLSLSPVSGFGPDSGTCPAPQTLMTKGGVPVVWSWQMYCDFASGIRPLIVGFAWLSALMIVIGVARRNG